MNTSAQQQQTFICCQWTLDSLPVCLHHKDTSVQYCIHHYWYLSQYETEWGLVSLKKYQIDKTLSYKSTIWTNFFLTQFVLKICLC